MNEGKEYHWYAGHLGQEWEVDHTLLQAKDSYQAEVKQQFLRLLRRLKDNRAESPENYRDLIDKGLLIAARQHTFGPLKYVVYVDSRYAMVKLE